MSGQLGEDGNVYVDPDEDEVFFGEISDREIQLKARVRNRKTIFLRDIGAGDSVNITSDLTKQCEILPEKLLELSDGSSSNRKTHNDCKDASITEDDHGIHELVSNLHNTQIREVCEELQNQEKESGLAEEFVGKSKEKNAGSDIFDKSSETTQEHQSNTDNIDLEHNYSTPLKSKIDKSILSTPKSVVRADKDGGFLKVLSEIALVKAEEENGSKKTDGTLKTRRQVPDLIVNEATPIKIDDLEDEEMKFEPEVKKFCLVYNTPNKVNSDDPDLNSDLKFKETKENILKKDVPLPLITDQKYESKSVASLKNHIQINDSPLSNAILQNVEALCCKNSDNLTNLSSDKSFDIITIDSDSDDEMECTDNKKGIQLFEERKNVSENIPATETILLNGTEKSKESNEGNDVSKYTPAIETIQLDESGSDEGKDESDYIPAIETIQLEDKKLNDEGKVVSENIPATETIQLDKSINDEGKDEPEFIPTTETIQLEDKKVNDEGKDVSENIPATETMQLDKSIKDEPEYIPTTEATQLEDKKVNDEGKDVSENIPATETIFLNGTEESKESNEGKDISKCTPARQTTQLGETKNTKQSDEGKDEPEYTPTTETIQLEDKNVNDEGKIVSENIPATETIFLNGTEKSKESNEGNDVSECLNLTETVQLLENQICNVGAKGTPVNHLESNIKIQYDRTEMQEGNSSTEIHLEAKTDNPNLDGISISSKEMDLSLNEQVISEIKIFEKSTNLCIVNDNEKELNCKNSTESKNTTREMLAEGEEIVEEIVSKKSIGSELILASNEKKDFISLKLIDNGNISTSGLTDNYDDDNIKLEDEVKKMIEVLQTAVDDSLDFTLQEYDLDKSDMSLLGDGIGKLSESPVRTPKIFTSKQTELLKEIISAKPNSQPSTPVPTPTKTKEITSAKRNHQPSTLISTSIVTKEIISAKRDHQPSTPISTSTATKESGSLKKTVEKDNSKVKSTRKNATPLKVFNKENTLSGTKSAGKEITKRTPISSGKKVTTTNTLSSGKRDYECRSDGKVVKCAKKLDVGVNVLKAGGNTLTGEKNVGKDFKVPVSSRIPKLGSSASKIPQVGKLPTPKCNIKLAIAKETPKSVCTKLQFANVESPVNAYITNKPPSLVQNIKPDVKKDSAQKFWMKEVCSVVKAPTDDESFQISTKHSKREIATPLPSVEYKMATSLKLEKPIESRLPRLAPTMKKLIHSGSPTILKHEGRIQLSTPRMERISADDTFAVNPNEVSVVVSHAAQKSNTMN